MGCCLKENRKKTVCTKRNAGLDLEFSLIYLNIHMEVKREGYWKHFNV